MSSDDTRAITEIALRYRIGDRHFEVSISPRAVDALLIGDAIERFADGESESRSWTPKHAPYIAPPKPIGPVGGRHELVLENGRGPCVHLYPCWVVCFPPEWMQPGFDPRSPFEFDDELRDLDPRIDMG